MATDYYADIQLICQQLAEAALTGPAEEVAAAMARGMSATEVLMAVRHSLTENMARHDFPVETLTLTERTIKGIDAALSGNG